MTDTDGYARRKLFFDGLLTVYGRKPVMEALQASDIHPHRLHLADSNRPGKELNKIISVATARDAEIIYHDREALSRISRNRRQDQGVALDIKAPGYQPLERLPTCDGRDVVLLENVTNPQNLGMIIRSVAASPSAGLVLPRKGNARIDGLVIKASSGAIFKAPIFHCGDVPEALSQLHKRGYQLAGLSPRGNCSFSDLPEERGFAFLLGNETSGLSDQVLEQCDLLVNIPLNNRIESLNVSAAATLAAFRGLH